MMQLSAWTSVLTEPSDPSNELHAHTYTLGKQVQASPSGIGITTAYSHSNVVSIYPLYGSGIPLENALQILLDVITRHSHLRSDHQDGGYLARLHHEFIMKITTLPCAVPHVFPPSKYDPCVSHRMTASRRGHAGAVSRPRPLSVL